MRPLFARPAERQLIVLPALRHGNFVQDGGAVGVRYPAAEHVGAHAARQPQLVARDRRSGGVEQQKRLALGGRGDGDGVGSHARLRAERGQHEQPAGGGGHAHHVRFRRQHRVMPNRARMSGVPHRHRAHADVPRLLYRQRHRLRTENHRQPAVGVHRRRRGRFADNLPVRHGVERPLRVALHVRAEHVRDAVSLHPAQVGGDENVRADAGVVGLHPHLLENGGDGRVKRLARNPNLIFLRNLEPFEHGELTSRRKR